MATVVAMLGSEIVGQSTLPGYQNQVDAIAITHSIHLPISWDGQTRTTGSSSRHGALELTRYIDRASPKIYQACSRGRVIPSVRVIVYKTGESGAIEKFLIINVRNSYISRASIATGQGQDLRIPNVIPENVNDSLLESLSLSYSAIHWDCGSIEGSWDLEEGSSETYHPVLESDISLK